MGSPNLRSSQEVDEASLDKLESQSTQKSPRSKLRLQSPWKAHTRKIFLACGIVVIPMIVLTVALIWTVFANVINDNRCPILELCPGPEILNATSRSYYYVDYPAARLVFISSWTSTVSFSFVSMLMTLFGYVIACQMLRKSSTEQSDRLLPSPYQTSLLMRVLNADLLSLWDLGSKKVKSVFWAREHSISEGGARSPQILRSSIFMFLFCLLASILVQAADTYLHIVTEAADMIQIQTKDAQQHLYSRGLAPWCLNRPSMGSKDNRNFWGCGVVYDEVLNFVALNNFTTYNSIEVGGPRSNDAIYNYTAPDGLHFSLVGPASPPSDTDWKATSIGVSASCAPVPPSACTRDAISTNGSHLDVSENFRCTREKAGFEARGNMSGYLHDIYFFDFHKYLHEPYPFDATYMVGFDEAPETALNVTDDEEVFKNPWTSLSVATIELDRADYPDTMKGDDLPIWHDGTSPYDFTLLVCNTTVYDVTYTAIGRNITSLEATTSNGSTAGIASMPGVAFWQLIPSEYERALQLASASASSVGDFVGAYAAGLTKIYSYSMATQLSPRPALLAQTRVSKVITKVPVVALWLLVVANGLYALTAICLAVLAFMYTSPSVHQVYTRLSITGLVAQLFEREYAERAVDSEEALFRENVERGAEIKRVGVVRTNTGGSTFAVSEKSRKTGTINLC